MIVDAEASDPEATELVVTCRVSRLARHQDRCRVEALFAGMRGEAPVTMDLRARRPEMIQAAIDTWEPVDLDSPRDRVLVRFLVGNRVIARGQFPPPWHPDRFDPEDQGCEECEELEESMEEIRPAPSPPRAQPAPPPEPSPAPRIQPPPPPSPPPARSLEGDSRTRDLRVPEARREAPPAAPRDSRTRDLRIPDTQRDTVPDDAGERDDDGWSPPPIDPLAPPDDGRD